MTITRVSLITLMCLVCAELAAGQATNPSIRLLGDKFESKAAGISLRPPAGAKLIRGALGSSEIVQFRDDDRKWIVKLSRVLLQDGKPVPLTNWIGKDGKEYPGMLELTIEQFKLERPGATILRQDTTNIKDIKVGMMAAKYDFGLNTNIMQEAIIRADDLQYYILSMNCTAPRNGEASDDPGVKLAVETFTQMLDTVEVHDQFDVTLDRNERLMRTKMLYVNLTERALRAALQPEQWFRLIRDGKDIGYTYEVEQIGRDLPRQGQVESATTGPEGVLIGVRTRLIPEAGLQTDGESWLFCTFNRQFEAFSTLAYTQTPTGRSTSGEIGTSRLREKAVADTTPGIGGKRGVSLTQDYHLEVNKFGAQSHADPVERDLPPYYLPQAIGKLLPRLVPLREPDTYVFVGWVSEANEVVYRYLDVGREKEVVLAGRRVRAVPVEDRIGLEGSVTTHYLTMDGKYLGCINEDSKITMVTTDAPTLEKLWRDANLSRPGSVSGDRR